MKKIFLLFSLVFVAFATTFSQTTTTGVRIDQSAAIPLSETTHILTLKGGQTKRVSKAEFDRYVDSLAKQNTTVITNDSIYKKGGNNSKMANNVTEKFGIGMNTEGGNSKSFVVGVNPNMGYTNAMSTQSLYAYDMYNPSGKSYASMNRATNGDKRFLYTQKSNNAGVGVTSYNDYTVIRDSATGAYIERKEYADVSGLYRNSIKTATIVSNTFTNQQEFRQSLLPTGVPSDLATLRNGSFEYREDSSRYFVKTAGGVKKIAYTDDTVLQDLSTYTLKKESITSNNIAYVSKKYKVVGDSSFIAQIAEAQIGSTSATFPNVWLAMAAITPKLISKEIDKATIIVHEGNIYKTAENLDTAGLGQLDYVYRKTGSYYHPFPSRTLRTDDDSLCLSIVFPNLNVIFNKNSGINHIAGQGVIAAIYDTMSTQLIGGLGTFVHNVTNDRTNNGSGIGVNQNITTGISKGSFEFTGDSLITGRTSPAYSGWAMLSGWASTTSYNFNYVSTFENNSLFRGSGKTNVKIVKFMTDTISLPYMYQNSPYSPSAIFLSPSNYNISIEECYIASNPIFHSGMNNTTLNINKITQKYRNDYVTFFVGTNADSKPTLIGLSNSTSSVIAWNGGGTGNTTININTYRGQSPVFVIRGSGNFKNANIEINFKSVYQDSIHSSYGVTPKTSMYFAHTGILDSSLISINANIINSATSAIYLDNNTALKSTIGGKYVTLSTVKPAVELIGDNGKTKINGALSVNGTQSSISGTGTITILPSSTANTAADSTVTQQGSPLIPNAAYKY